jgi:hypothetical protein
LSAIEYRLRWKVDDQGNFLRWEQLQFIGDSQFYGVRTIGLFISKDKIEGLTVVVGNFYFFLPNENELDFEFKDKTLKSTIVKIVNNDKGKYGIVSINRFTKEAMEKFS